MSMLGHLKVFIAILFFCNQNEWFKLLLQYHNKGNAKGGISPPLQIWPLTLKINRVPDSLKD